MIRTLQKYSTEFCTEKLYTKFYRNSFKLVDHFLQRICIESYRISIETNRNAIEKFCWFLQKICIEILQKPITAVHASSPDPLCDLVDKQWRSGSRRQTHQTQSTCPAFSSSMNMSLSIVDVRCQTACQVHTVLWLVGCTNGWYKLRQWKEQWCTLHGINYGIAHCFCDPSDPPFKLFTFPTVVKDSEGRKRWIRAVIHLLWSLMSETSASSANMVVITQAVPRPAGFTNSIRILSLL